MSLYSYKNRCIERDSIKRDLQKYSDELQELKTTITNIMDMYSKNNKDEVDDLKKQLQNMIDIHNIKKEIVELRKDTERLTQAVAAVAAK
jgi:chromosome segregation ATPase